MRVLVMGATGRTGRALLDELLAGGHEVTALARGADGLPQRQGLTTVAGDATDRAVVADLLGGHDAVALTLGFTGNPLRARVGRADEAAVTVHSRAVDALLAAGDGRALPVVYLSSYGAGAHAEHLGIGIRLAYWALLRPIREDHARAERLLRASSLEWTVVQAVGLTDGDATGDVVVSPEGATRSSRVSRADVARVMARAATSDAWSRETVVVSG